MVPVLLLIYSAGCHVLYVKYFKYGSHVDCFLKHYQLKCINVVV
jgi:hypothetical protein